jgi:hypothetical protein
VDARDEPGHDGENNPDIAHGDVLQHTEVIGGDLLLKRAHTAFNTPRRPAHRLRRRVNN